MNSGPDAIYRQTCSLMIRSAALAAALLSFGLSGCSAPSLQTAKITSNTRMGIADIAAEGGDVEGARSILAAAAQSDPSNAELQLHYAYALLQTGHDSEAIAAAQLAVSHAQKNAALIVKAAQLELHAGNASLAAATFQSAAVIGGAGTPALNGLGVARVQLGDLRGAEDAFRHAMAISPGDYAARNNLALALVLQGRADDAVPLLQSLADEPGVPGRVLHNLALAYAQQGDLDLAAQALTGVVSSSALASREIQAFSTLRSQAGTQVASRFGPAELLQGRTSGAAYAGTLPAPTAGVAVAAAAPLPQVAPLPQAVAAVPDAKIAMLRAAPLAAVKATPIAPPATVVAQAQPAPATPVAVAPAIAPVAVATAAPTPAVAPIKVAAAPVAAPAAPPPTVDYAEPVLLAARLLGDQPLTVLSSAEPVPAHVVVTEPGDDGNIKVSIALVATKSEAAALWQNLAGMLPDLLDGRAPMMKFARDHGRPAWHLGTGGFTDVASAEEFCRQLRGRGHDCAIGL